MSSRATTSRSTVPDDRRTPGPAELEQVAAATARTAAALIRSSYGRPEHVGNKSSPTDVVTETDIRAEELIRRLLRDATPEAGVLGEEGEATSPAARPGLPRGGGGDAAPRRTPRLGHRPARRHRQLPLQRPAVHGERRGRAR